MAPTVQEQIIKFKINTENVSTIIEMFCENLNFRTEIKTILPIEIKFSDQVIGAISSAFLVVVSCAWWRDGPSVRSSELDLDGILVWMGLRITLKQ